MYNMHLGCPLCLVDKNSNLLRHKIEPPADYNSLQMHDPRLATGACVPCRQGLQCTSCMLYDQHSTLALVPIYMSVPLV